MVGNGNASVSTFSWPTAHVRKRVVGWLVARVSLSCPPSQSRSCWDRRPRYCHPCVPLVLRMRMRCKWSGGCEGPPELSARLGATLDSVVTLWHDPQWRVCLCGCRALLGVLCKCVTIFTVKPKFHAVLEGDVLAGETAKLIGTAAAHATSHMRQPPLRTRCVTCGFDAAPLHALLWMQSS